MTKKLLNLYILINHSYTKSEVNIISSNVTKTIAKIYFKIIRSNLEKNNFLTFCLKILFIHYNKSCAKKKVLTKTSYLKMP